LDSASSNAVAVSSTFRLAIAAIFKNEAPYILEWVAFHRVLGVDRFFIADNASNDGTTELLAALASAGIVTHIPFPGVPDKPPQLLAYAEILRRHKHDADWIAFIDADEFLMPTDGARSVRPVFEDIGEREDIGAVIVNWAVYGSSGRTAMTDEPVIERFSHRAEQFWAVNNHYKTIIRGTATSGPDTNPHAFHLNKGLKAVYADGRAAVDHPKRGKGLSEAVVWDRLRLNHYVVKSRDEFLSKKRARGRATVSNQLRPESFFEVHDKNEVADPMPGWLVAATKKEIAKLERLLSARGYQIPFRTHIRSALARWVGHGPDQLDTAAPRPQPVASVAAAAVAIDDAPLKAPLLPKQPPAAVAALSIATRGNDFFRELNLLRSKPIFKVAIDVGANTGGTVKGLKARFPDCKVHAFEPVMSTFTQLQKNIGHIDGVTCYNFAVSSVGNTLVKIENLPGSVDNRILDNSSTSSYDLVTTITGADFCRDHGIKHVDFLKIGTEGHDLEVLKGFRNLFAQKCIGFVEIECGMNRLNTKHVNIRDIMNFFGDLDYDFFGLYEQIRELNTGMLLRRANVVMALTTIK
jgi:FkbM family methyltransferase